MSWRQKIITVLGVAVVVGLVVGLTWRTLRPTQ